MKSYRSDKRVQKSPYQNVDIHQWIFHPRLPETMDSHITHLRTLSAGFINTRSTDNIFVYHQATNVVCVFVVYAI